MDIRLLANIPIAFQTGSGMQVAIEYRVASTSHDALPFHAREDKAIVMGVGDESIVTTRTRSLHF